MAIPPERKLTYEHYLHFPDSERWEIIDGEAFRMGAPTWRHQKILGELYFQVVTHIKRHGGGEVVIAPFDVVLSDHDVVQPDLVFVADNDMDVLTPANAWGVPTWLVEVLSDPFRDRNLKLQRYEHFGVSEYWIVDPKTDRVEVYRLEEGRYGAPTVHAPPEHVSPLLPTGLVIDLVELFSA